MTAASEQFANQLKLAVSLPLGQLAHQPGDGPLGGKFQPIRCPQ